MKEAITFYELIVEYNHLVLDSAEVVNIHPEVRPAFGFLLDELKFDRMYESYGVVQKVQCMSDAITAGVKETDFAEKWRVQKEELQKLFYRIESCKNEPNKLAEAK